MVAVVLIDRLVEATSRGRVPSLTPLLLLIQAPLCSQWLLLYAASCELQLTNLLGHAGALTLRVQARHKLRDETACFLRVQVAHLLGHVDQGVDLLVVALLGTIFHHTASSTDLHGQLFTTGVPHKLARALLQVPETEEVMFKM